MRVKAIKDWRNMRIGREYDVPWPVADVLVKRKAVVILEDEKPKRGPGRPRKVAVV